METYETHDSKIFIRQDSIIKVNGVPKWSRIHDTFSKKVTYHRMLPVSTLFNLSDLENSAIIKRYNRFRKRINIVYSASDFSQKKISIHQFYFNIVCIGKTSSVRKKKKTKILVDKIASGLEEELNL
jgi:hypothetical protein